MAPARSRPLSGQLPFVLQLLEDESPLVRRGVVRELRRYGVRLAPALEQLDPPASTRHRELLQELLRDHLGRLLLRQWGQVVLCQDPDQKLEAGLEAVSLYVDGFKARTPLPTQLDQSAATLRTTLRRRSLAELIRKLRLGPARLLGGAVETAPAEAFSLAQMMAGGSGIPLGQALVLRQIARRLDLECEVWPLPGLVLVAETTPSGRQFLDPAASGPPLARDQIASFFACPAPLLQRLQGLPPEVDHLLEQWLRTFLRSMRRRGAVREAALSLGLLRSLHGRRIGP